MRVQLGYGKSPMECEVPDSAEVVDPPRAKPFDVPAALASALAAPISAPRLRGRVAANAAVTIIISDATRYERRAEMVAALVEEISAPVRLTIAVANGTHAPGDVTGLADELGVHGARIVNHDGGGNDFIDVGTTALGTRVRYPQFLLRSDFVIATGTIRPHYFAGYGAGVKAIFPGLGCRDDIRQNHRLKSESTARLGRVEDNICRLDMEEAARMLPIPSFLLNLHDTGAVAGDVVLAFREGCNYMTCSVIIPDRADVVITSDRLPVSGSLYQASKLLAPAGPILRPGGRAILVAECPFGVGPVDVVNQGIYEIGIRKLFPEPHIIYLVSSLTADVVATTYCRYAPSVEAALADVRGRIVVLPHAGHIVPRA